MKERLFEIIKKNELTAWRFAELLEVQPSSISHILSGRNKPSFDFIEKILTRFPEINPDWLILGQGDMVRSGYSDELVIHEAESSAEPTLFDLMNEDIVSENTVTNVNSIDAEEVKEHSEIEFTNVKQDNYAQIEDKTTHSTPIVPIVNNDNVERVIVFYTNGTFSSYSPK